MKHISVLRKVCKDLERVENYEPAVADNFRGWVLHHRLELTLDGEQAHTAEELNRLGMYYGRPYFELVFLRRSEHITLHNIAKSKSGLYEGRRCKISAAVRRAYSEGRINVTGERNGMFGKTPWNKGTAKPKEKKAPRGVHVCSEETKRKIAEAKREYWKTHTIPAEQQRKMAQARDGKSRGKYKLSYTTWYKGPDGKRIYVKKGVTIRHTFLLVC